MVFVIAVAKFRNATSANVIYSSRGLWSVVAVWAVEQRDGHRAQGRCRPQQGWNILPEEQGGEQSHEDYFHAQHGRGHGNVAALQRQEAEQLSQEEQRAQ